jgi:uncharacterized membrane protein YidH (DUF202 family)
MIAPLAWRLALAMAAFGFTFVILGGMLGASLGFMAETDLGSSLIIVSVMLLVNGGLRRPRRPRRMGKRSSLRLSPG